MAMSFGLTFDKLILIAVIAVFLIGPDRLPGYAARLAQLVRQLRTFADGAKDRMREEMGDDFDEVDWRKLDPRQYDPRRIIREAITEGLSDDPVSTSDPDPEPVAASEAAEPHSRYVESAYEQRRRKAGNPVPAPYDVEST
jgi:sec-independent protein translocase protein TatB